MGWNDGELLAALSFPSGGLPQDALDAALCRYDEIKDQLYAAIKLGPDDVEALEKEHNKEYTLKFFAMYMAAEKHDIDAFAPMHEYFSTAGEKAWKYLGKMTSGNLVEVLSSVCATGVNQAEINLDGMDAYARIAFSDALSMRGNDWRRANSAACVRQS